MNTTKIIILGGKGTAVNVAEAIYDAQYSYNQPLEFLGFAFDDESFGNSINGFPILCKTTDVYEKFGSLDDVKFIFQMYREDKMVERAALIKSYAIPEDKYYNFIHPSAFVSKSVKLGVGNVVYAHCAIHANTIIGNHCMFSAHTTIGHDSNIGNSVFTATHVCVGSSVNLGDSLFLGQNVGVRGSIDIVGGNIIGIGSNVVSNINDTNSVFVGTPAKKVRSIN
ncbi:LbetaH domain-containing protein [Soonwooa sp.]|uniref:hypothetical protein n=1 Tax=Soonwooa sp. TaxID=1938592 RepID=UPI0035AE16C4